MTFQETEPETKKLRNETNHNTTGEDRVSISKHNNWRYHSLFNPVWKAKEFYEGLKTKRTHVEKQTIEDFIHKCDFHFTKPNLQIENVELDLTTKEKSIFEFLLNINTYFKLNDTVLRVAGGWVRNKLMGLPGHDIDIALNDRMGADYAKLVKNYALSHGMDNINVGIIKANPDQSKHLESATTYIFQEPIDFVNLRCEEYATDSRIPSSMKLGTPKEDAYRRDLTINSLFYDIKNKKIEDFTERGVMDLKRGIVRTPLPPLQTFLDDPLRVLRAVRFASSLNFIIADELIDAARDERIENQLAEKVSRERFGIEVGKMLSGPDPAGALSLMHEMQIIGTVFSLSTAPAKKFVRDYKNPIAIEWSEEQWENTLFRTRVVSHIMAMENVKEKSALALAACLSNVAPVGSYEKCKDWCDNLISCGLKLPTKLSTEVNTIIQGSISLNQILLQENEKQYLQCQTKQELKEFLKQILLKNRVKIGNWLRSQKELYTLSCYLSSVVRTKGTEFTESAHFFIEKENANHSFYFVGQVLVEAIRELKMDDLIVMKPMLNGNEISDLLQTKPGPGLASIINSLVDWQIEHFQESNLTKEDAKSFILSTNKNS